MAAARTSSSLWQPLRTPAFRNLLIADVVSDIGTFMQSVGAAWLMVSLAAGPLYVALIQTASTLPFFLLALPAGAIGDIVDRRRLILWTEGWMLSVAIILAALTLTGVMTPWMLLALTFALSAGDAFETPTWRAILPELVRKEDLATASALNGIEFNFARAVGPALAGVLIATAGVGAAFLVNVVSFLGVIIVVGRWKRPARALTTPRETVSGATVAAIRYVRFSPAIRAVIFRAGIVVFFASALLALLPSIAHSISDAATGYGLLLGCFGAGAVMGALAMQPARARWTTEAVASTGVVLLGASIVAIGGLRHLSALCVVTTIAGGAWIVFTSLVNAIIQGLAPEWVRARILAIFILTFQGGMAAGSVVWGFAAAHYGVHTALLVAGVGTIASTALGLAMRLPDTTADVSPWVHWRTPAIVRAVEPGIQDGPVLVTVEYDVDASQAAAFVDALVKYGRIRRRDGAFRWGVYRDLENVNRFLETFLVGSWGEHLRQHGRSTRADLELEQRLRSYARREPIVRHLVYASAARARRHDADDNT